MLCASFAAPNVLACTAVCARWREHARRTWRLRIRALAASRKFIGKALRARTGPRTAPRSGCSASREPSEGAERANAPPRPPSRLRERRRPPPVRLGLRPPAPRGDGNISLRAQPLRAMRLASEGDPGRGWGRRGVSVPEAELRVLVVPTWCVVRLRFLALSSPNDRNPSLRFLTLEGLNTRPGL